MRQEQTGGRFADENRREGNRILGRIAGADAGGTFAHAQVEHYAAGEAARLDRRPTLRDQLKEMRFGKEPTTPVPTVTPAQVLRRELTEKVLDINAELAQQPRRKAELERERDQIAAQLEVMRNAP